MMMGSDVRTVVYMYVLSYPQILTTLMKADRNNAVGHPFKTLALFFRTFNTHLPHVDNLFFSLISFF